MYYEEKAVDLAKSWETKIIHTSWEFAVPGQRTHFSHLEILQLRISTLMTWTTGRSPSTEISCCTGLVVLKDVLPEELYMNFLQLSVSVYILCSEKWRMYYSNYIKQQCLLFVQRFTELYGEDQLFFNILSWMHICQDVRAHGSVDRFSAFPYKHMRKVRRCVTSRNGIVEQIFRLTVVRIAEARVHLEVKLE